MALKQFFRFVTHDMWHITETELTPGMRVVYRIVTITVLSVRGFFNDALNIRASALAFSLLFAMVPIMALILAIARGFGFEDVIEGWLGSSTIGGTDVVPIIMEFVQRYLETARGGVFLGIGIVILLFSVYMFFQQAESAINSIWQVKKSRSFARQFTTYFSVLLIMPILIVLTSGFSIFLNSTLSKMGLLNPAVETLLRTVPLVGVWISFTLIYLIVPNTKVHFGNACISGIIAGTAFQLFQLLYVWGQVYLSRYNAVYGSFAAIPLLLLWLQISSLIILAGAEIAFLTQNIRNFDYEVDTKNISRRYKDYIGLYIVYMAIKRFEREQPAITVKDIIAENHLPIRLVSRLLDRLVDAGLLIEVYTDGDDDRAYQPAVDINKMTIGLYITRLESYGSELFITNKTDEMKHFWVKNLAIKSSIEQHANTTLIKDML